MSANLLLSMSTPMWITVGALGALSIASVIYGVFRNFVRMSWTSWQLLLIFAITLLLKVIPVPSGWQGFAVGAGVLVGATALVLISGHLIRRYMMKKPTRSHKFFRVMNRILGALTALLDIVLLLAVIGGFALNVIYYTPTAEGLDVIFTNPVWTQFGAVYVQDLVLIFFCILFMRGGYRIGLVRSLQTVVMIALIFGALFLVGYLALVIPFLRSWTRAMAGSMSGNFGLNIIPATMISYFIVVAILFLVLFALIMTGGYFLNKGIRKYRALKPALTAIDGVILSVVFTLAFVGLVCGFYFGVSAALQTLAERADGASIADVLQTVENFFTASPLSALLYRGNPLLLTLGA